MDKHYSLVGGKGMKLTVLQLLDLESGLFAIGDKELLIATSLKINRAITSLEPVTHTIRETAQPLLKLEHPQQQEKLNELYQEEMDVELPMIQLDELEAITIQANVLRHLSPILSEGENSDEN